MECSGREQTLYRLLRGSDAEIDAAISILFREDAPTLADRLESAFEDWLSGAECRDILDHAFELLMTRALNRETGGMDSPAGWLWTTMERDGWDLVRHKKVQRRTVDKVADAATPPETPDPREALVRKERAEAAAKQLVALKQGLEDAARRMKPKQQAVALAMLEIFSNGVCWPSNERIAELLQEAEPGLDENTVKDRRKEVRAKFNIILEAYGRSTIAE